MKQHKWRACVFVGMVLYCPLVLASETAKPVSMSAEDFSRLSGAEQRALLVRVIQRRLEHARNLHYEVYIHLRIDENEDGEPGKLLQDGPPRRCRHWRLGDSYRLDTDLIPIGKQEPVQFVVSGFNAEDGVGRGTVRMRDRERAFGRIDTIHDTLATSNFYNLWLDGEFPDRREYLFRYLLDRADEFAFKAPVAEDKVELTVSYQPIWANKPGGKRVFLLDPRKGFLPIKGDSRWDDPKKKDWRAEKFVVEESRLVADVWMPTKLRLHMSTAAHPESISTLEMNILQMKYGTVKPSDLVVPFTKGMEVVDAILGVTYTADAQGNPEGTIKRVLDNSGIERP